MFLPVSLDEASAWLDKNEVNGVTSRDLLRLGYAGLFQICLPLSESAYSPLKRVEIFKKNFDAGHDIDIQKEHEASYVELYGLYALPCRTLFELEANGKAKTSVVFSLDNAAPFHICKDITTDALRVTYQALKILISHIEISPSIMQDNTTRPQMQQRFQESEILRVIGELGFTATKLPTCEAGKRGVKAQVRDELKFSVKVFDKAWERLRADKSIKE